MSDLKLRAACIHGCYEEHIGDREREEGLVPCPGGRKVTDAEIVTMANEIREKDKADVTWPEVIGDTDDVATGHP